MSGVKMLKNIFIATSFGVVVAAVELETGFDANDADPAGSIKFVNVKNVTTPGDRSSTDVPEVQYRSDMNPKLFELFESSDEVKIPVWRKNNCACSKVPLFGRLCDDRAGYFVFNLKEKNVPVKWISDKNEVVNGRSLPKKTVNQKTKINPNRDFDDNLPLFFNDVNFTDMEQIQFKITLKNSEEFMIRKNADTAVAELDFNFGTEHGENRAETAKEVVIEMRRWLNGLVPLQTVRRRILAKRNVTQNHGRLLLEREQRRVARENREIVADVQRKNGVKRCVRSWKAARAAVARENRELVAGVQRKNGVKRCVRSWKAARAATAAASAEAARATAAAPGTAASPPPPQQERHQVPPPTAASTSSSSAHGDQATATAATARAATAAASAEAARATAAAAAPGTAASPHPAQEMEIFSQKFEEKLKATPEISMNHFSSTQLEEAKSKTDTEFNIFAISAVQSSLGDIIAPFRSDEKDIQEIKEDFGEKLVATYWLSSKKTLIKNQMYKPLFEKCVHHGLEGTAKKEWVRERAESLCERLEKENVEHLIQDCEDVFKRSESEAEREKRERETLAYEKFKSVGIEGARAYVMNQGSDSLVFGTALAGKFNEFNWTDHAEPKFHEFLASEYKVHPEKHALKFLLQGGAVEGEELEHVFKNWNGECKTRLMWADRVTEEYFEKVNGDGTFPAEFNGQFDPIKTMYIDAEKARVVEVEKLESEYEQKFTEHKNRAKAEAFAELNRSASPGDNASKFGKVLHDSKIASDEAMLEEAYLLMKEYIQFAYIPKAFDEHTPDQIKSKINHAISGHGSSFGDEQWESHFAELLAEQEKDAKIDSIKALFGAAYRANLMTEIRYLEGQSILDILVPKDDHAPGSKAEEYQRSHLEELYNRVENSKEEGDDAVADVVKALIKKRIQRGEFETTLGWGDCSRLDLEQQAVVDVFGTRTPATADAEIIASFAWSVFRLIPQGHRDAIIAESKRFPVQRPRKTFLRAPQPIAQDTPSAYAMKHTGKQTGFAAARASTSRRRATKPHSFDSLPSSTRVFDNTQGGQAGFAVPPTHAAPVPVANTVGGAATRTRAERL